MSHAMKTLPAQFHRPARRIRASALVMAVLLSVVITAMVMMIAWTAGTQAQSVSALRNLDQAFFAAEAGAQRAAWFVAHQQLGSQSQPMAGSCGTAGYSVTWSNVSGSTYRITSVGTSGTSSDTASLTATPASSPAALASRATLNITSASTNITGDVVSVGTITGTGNGTITGSIDSGGTVSATVQGWVAAPGTTKQNDATMTSPPDPAAIYTSVQPTAAATHTLTGNQSNPVLDFSTYSMIYVNGNVSFSNGAPIPTGSGTLVVHGTVTFGGTFPSDGSSAKMNIVSDNTITTGGTTRITGGIYTSGQFKETGTHYMTGVILAGSVTVNGQTYYASAVPPSFDPRSASSGGASGSNLVISNFFGENLP